MSFTIKLCKSIFESGDKKGEGAAYGNLGTAYENLKQYDNALLFQQKAIAIHSAIGANQDLYYFQWAVNLPIPEDSFLRSQGLRERWIQQQLIDRGISIVVAAGNEATRMIYIPQSRLSEKRVVFLDSKQQIAAYRLRWPERERSGTTGKLRIFLAWDDLYGVDEKRTTDLKLQIFNASSSSPAQGSEPYPHPTPADPPGNCYCWPEIHH